MPGRRRKHVPQRMCISCRDKHPKRELIRIVRTPEGTIEIDPRGKRSGRGAYLCRKRQCWEEALEPRRLSLALKVPVSQEDVAALRDSGMSLSEEAAAEPQTTPSVEAGAGE